jgi:methylated-DNA-protein-cysteine methyltransferase-like protein
MIAVATGYKNMARQVGFALHANPQPDKTPCFRVVFADGSLSPAFAFGGINMQRKLLAEEGVLFDKNGKVLPQFFCGIKEITL